MRSLFDANAPLRFAGLLCVDSRVEHLALGLIGALRRGCGSTSSVWIRSCLSRPALVVDLSLVSRPSCQAGASRSGACLARRQRGPLGRPVLPCVYAHEGEREVPQVTAAAARGDPQWRART